MKDKPTDTIDVPGILTTHTTVPLRIESTLPVTIRRVCYPNGREALQGGYSWQEGSEGGVAWRDLPLIYVDIQGQEKEPNT